MTTTVVLFFVFRSSNKREKNNAPKIEIEEVTYDTSKYYKCSKCGALVYKDYSYVIGGYCGRCSDSDI